MKAITLTQPWATLLAARAKVHETRSWKTNHRGLLAIHAAAGVAPIGGERGLRAIIRSEPFWRVLRIHLSGYTLDELIEAMPRGAIIALAVLADCRPAADVGARLLDDGRPPAWLDLQFGDFSEGRFAWRIADVLELEEPLPCRGALGLWNVPPAAEKYLRENYPAEIAGRELEMLPPLEES